MLIYAPPAVLTLHLKRFEQVGPSLRKLSRHVEFSELLDLAPYCSRLAEVAFIIRCFVHTVIFISIIILFLLLSPVPSERNERRR